MLDVKAANVTDNIDRGGTDQNWIQRKYIVHSIVLYAEKSGEKKYVVRWYNYRSVNETL